MSSDSYSSFEAFVAHYRALKLARKLAPEESVRLTEIERQIESLKADVDALFDSREHEAIGPQARKRERIERRLRRELIARGIING